LSFSNFGQIQQSLKSGNISLPEVVQNYIQNIEERNDEINAVVSLDTDDVLTQAKQIQKRIEEGTAGKLAGMVIGV